MSSKPTRALVGLALAGLVTSSVVPMATAGERKGGGDDSDGKVVASGLDSPRHLSVTSRGEVYVAEAGTGGDDCIDYGEGDEAVEVCAGTTGAVTRVSRRGHQSRVVEDLPSVGVEGDYVGPSGVERRRGSLWISVGLGGPPDARDQLVDEHGRDYRRLATIQRARLHDDDSPSLRTVADLARFETRENPDDGELDTNPNSITRDGRGWLIADAGGNYVARLNSEDRLRLVAALPEGEAEAPDGSEVAFQSVPTSAVRGPDGAVYVSELTGYPFPADGASIWRIGRSGTPRMWATGLTNVTDLAFDDDGHLYAVQLSDVGLLNEEEGALPSGSLVRVRKGSDNHRTVVDDLEAPFGVALHDDHAYISTCSVCTDDGEVQRFDLDD